MASTKDPAPCGPISTRRRGSTTALAALCGLLAGAACGQENAVPVAGGIFVMGTDAGDIPELRRRYRVVYPGVFENEAPAHEVTLGAFRIDRFETTNADFAAFVAARPEWHPANLAADRHNGRYLESWNGGRPPAGQDAHPIVFVTWAAAQSYCAWRGGRLPTEAEWEFVARAGDERQFPWGDELPGPDRANYGASGLDRTSPVGSYPPNPLGVHDLAGNVWEFLLDEWQERYPAAAVVDPVAGGLAAATGDVAAVTGRRAVRGASFGGSMINLRTRWRDSHVAGNAIGFVGFRCAYPK